MARKIVRNVQETRNELYNYFNLENESIGRTNLHILRIVSVVTFLLILLLLLITPLFIWKWKVSWYHVSLLIMTFVYAVISWILNKKQIYNRDAVTILSYSFLSFLMIFLTALDTMENPDAAETFMVGFLIIAPILFIVPVVPMLISQILYTIIFMIVVMNVKADRIIGGDCIQAVYGCAVGIIIYFIVLRVRLQEFREKTRYRISSEIDGLTQINNRANSKRQIDSYLAHKLEKESCAMLMMDVDRFKQVNDTLGHKNGDTVLRETAKILTEVFYEDDIVGRFGGDEFVILMKNIEDPSIIEKKCTQLNEKMKTVLAGKFPITCSVGVCYLKSGRTSDENLFRIADESLYQAKNTGRANYIIQEYQNK